MQCGMPGIKSALLHTAQTYTHVRLITVTLCAMHLPESERPSRACYTLPTGEQPCRYSIGHSLLCHARIACGSAMQDLVHFMVSAHVGDTDIKEAAANAKRLASKWLLWWEAQKPGFAPTTLYWTFD